MTLILSALTRDAAFQVGDRLLTHGDGDPQVFDSSSNKQVIYFAGNGVLCIGYSGTAFINTTPTDRWIAECLLGQSLPQGRDFLQNISNDSRLDVGRTMEGLRDSIQSIWPTLPSTQKDISLGLHAVGWQKPKRSSSRYAFFAILEKNGIFRLESERIGRWVRTLFHSEIPRTLNTSENEARSKRLLEARLGETSQFEQALIDEVSRVSASTSLVGQNCTAVMMLLNSGKVFVRSYLEHPKHDNPAGVTDAHTGMFMTMGKRGDPPPSIPDLDSCEVAYTPWMVLPTMVIPPSAAVGTFTCDGCVEIIGPPSPPGVLAGFLSQLRPSAP